MANKRGEEAIKAIAKREGVSVVHVRTEMKMAILSRDLGMPAIEFLVQNKEKSDGGKTHRLHFMG